MLRRCRGGELKFLRPLELFCECISGSVETLHELEAKDATAMDLTEDHGRREASGKTEPGRCELCEGTCVTRDVGIILTRVGLRLTRQRLELGRLLFQGGDHHVTADSLHGHAKRQGIRVSLATIYNTLQQFTSAGLLRRLAIDGQKTWYDTNMSEHYHFFCEDDNCVFDIADGQVSISQMPAIPPGMEIARVEVVVRLKRR
jgi:Fur family transcriptional regulator, iron response regulator